MNYNIYSENKTIISKNSYLKKIQNKVKFNKIIFINNIDKQF